jgi:type I restriction enzyme S subunit
VLTDNLPLLAGAPNGIKKLRELILELAVRGKLVPQDSSDEPASELLKRINHEKVRLQSSGELKKQKLLAKIESKDEPHKLPLTWEWTRLGEITNFGTTTKIKKIPDDAWVLDLEDIEKDTSRLLERRRFSERNSLSDKNSFSRNDVLYGKLRPYLNKILVADSEGFCTTEILPFRCHGPSDSHFFKLALMSPYFLRYVNGKSYGMKMPRLGTEDGRQAAFPLPPLAEQHRIVAKVDELMALCETLEAQQANAESAHARLVQALLDSLTQASDAQDFATHWQCLSAHFDTLFTTESSIDALKQTLLQLAVMGKLVPQDPSDEPANNLLKKIQFEKQRMVVERSIKAHKSFPEISSEEVPFSVPAGWKWTRAELVSLIIVDCPHSTAKFIPEGMLCLDTNSFKQGRLIEHRLRYVDRKTFNERNARLIPMPGDIVFAREGLVGESIVIPGGVSCCLGQRVMLFRPSHVSSEYFRLAISEPSSLARILAMHKGIGAKHVNVADMRAALVPLPPLAEQHRIVAKVDELMTLCDQLKTRLRQARDLNQQLATTLVERAVA